ncbi:MAG TPA: phosphoribosyltransferase [Streptosporangiaceae bacterium]
MPPPYPLYPIGPDPPTTACTVCRGPARSGYARCYQCEAHEMLGHGLLADAVVPISYAVKGTPFADDLWRYKSSSSSQAVTPSGRSLLALLLAFLDDHAQCIWRRAAMPGPGPDRLAVVPSGVGRPGSHPLLALARPHISLPLWPLAIRPGRQGRDLDLHRFQAGAGPRGCGVLLLDDTWVSGASAQSAVAALKLAGAGRVALVVLGRHVNPADPRATRFAAGLASGPYDPAACAVHS